MIIPFKKNLTLACLLLGIFLSSEISVPAQYGKRWSISRDTLYVYSGLAQLYSVDTPRGEGLINTRISEQQLESELDASGIVRPAFTKEVHAALPPNLSILQAEIRSGIAQRIDILFTAGQRTPSAGIDFFIPEDINFSTEELSLDIIGRGDCPVSEIGNLAKISVKACPGSRIVSLRDVDLRPSNGVDVILSIHNAVVDHPSTLTIRASYTTSAPETLTSPMSEASISSVRGICDLKKECDPESDDLILSWTSKDSDRRISLLMSSDEGKHWMKIKKYEFLDGRIHMKLHETGKWLVFKLKSDSGYSNAVWHHPGRIDVIEAGIPSDGSDCTNYLNELIAETASRGGGELNFPDGEYRTRTVQLKSNVWLHLDKNATIKGMPGFDEPELGWFSDRDYRSGLSPTDTGPYKDPENYLTKQDVGHTFFRNAMFFGERISNVKITGNGRISGDGHLATSDKVLFREPGMRADKMFSFKLCKNIEIGGESNGLDMWYDHDTDAPVYLADGMIDHDCGHMLHIDQAGHFALLSTGSDNIYVHDTYFGAASTKNVRDIYDFMGCSNVKVSNIYSKVGSDDIVKLGSDCSLGFTRVARNYLIRNIVGDTNCNLFQIGSETADDIEDVYVDNIYVLGANKAGFSISTNDGAAIRNIFLNSGKTGPIHSRSVMLRTKVPFFISISNRGRRLGTEVRKVRYVENGILRDELLVTNSSIGKIENIHLGHIDISEVYAGSSYKKERWMPYDGTQPGEAPIFAGYTLPTHDYAGQNIVYDMPDGRTTGYVDTLYLEDITLTVKGGHPKSDSTLVPPELGVGKYNAKDFKTLPAYGMWFRHVRNLHISDCCIDAETPDGRPAVVYDDVSGKIIHDLTIKPTNY